jgi:hypothetical protein
VSEHFQGTFLAEDPEESAKRKEVVIRPDDGLCCVCRTPRPEGFRYLCEGCASTSVARVLAAPEGVGS